MNTTLFVFLLLAAIFGGWALKINGGIFAIVFAFLFGIFSVGMSASRVVGLWPTRLFMTILLITYYFGFAIQNGTMEGIVKRAMWVSRRLPPLLPIALYILTFVLAAVGVGAYSIFTFMAPLVMAISAASNMHTMIALLVIVSGTCVGSYSYTGQFGISMLISVGMHAGIVKELSAWAEKNISGAVAPYFLAVTAGTMSYFASTVNVVVPSLGAICGGISAGTGISVPLCYSYLNTGSAWSAFSPFSSGGAITLAAISNEEHRNELYKKALIFPWCALAFFLLQIFLGVMIT